MKITAIGANSAFATGTYEDVITLEDACEVALRIANSPEFKDASASEVMAEIKKRKQRLYRPQWQSNLSVTLFSL